MGPHTCSGTGSNKKAAKKEAAEAALVAMGYGPILQPPPEPQAVPHVCGEPSRDKKGEDNLASVSQTISDRNDESTTTANGSAGPGLNIKSARAIAPGLFVVSNEPFGTCFLVSPFPTQIG